MSSLLFVGCLLLSLALPRPVLDGVFFGRCVLQNAVVLALENGVLGGFRLPSAISVVSSRVRVPGYGFFWHYLDGLVPFWLTEYPLFWVLTSSPSAAGVLLVACVVRIWTILSPSFY